MKPKKTGPAWAKELVHHYDRARAKSESAADFIRKSYEAGLKDAAAKVRARGGLTAADVRMLEDLAQDIEP